MFPKVYLIHGVSQGLGFELVKQLSASSDNIIIATGRNPKKATALVELANSSPAKIHLIAWDSGVESSVASAMEVIKNLPFISEHGIDTLILNAGIMDGLFASPAESNNSQLVNNLNVNVVGTYNVTQAVLPLMKKVGGEKKIIAVTSLAGAFGGPISGLPVAFSYSVSKAALNMMFLKYANQLGIEGFKVILIHPGEVKTKAGLDLEASIPGGLPFDMITPTESVSAMLKVFDGLTTESNGKLYTHKGEIFPSW